MSTSTSRREAAALAAPSAQVGETPLRLATLRDQAKPAIRAKIVTGEIAAGAIHSVGSLATEFGVSPTPIREALLDLANEGLVEMIRNRGFRVPVLTEHDLDELFELRLMLEVGAATRLASEPQPTDVLAIARTYADETVVLAEKQDMATFLEADRMFHLHLLSALGNRRLVEIVGRLRNQTRLYGLLNLAQLGQLVESAHEHTRILDAIERGDVGGTRDAMTRHLEHTRGIWAGLEEPHRSPTGRG